MKLKDIGHEEYEWEEVTVQKSAKSEAYIMVSNNDGEVVMGEKFGFSYEEAMIWAVKLARSVTHEDPNK